MHKLIVISLLAAAAGCNSAPEGNASADGSANASNAAATETAQGTVMCNLASEADEKLICTDPQLQRLDRELYRVYQAAIKDPQATPTGDALAMKQDEWVTARSQCGADADPKSCIAADYAQRIHQLRQGSKAARDAAGGASEGPVAYRCKGMDALISATFVNVDPSVVYLEWLDQGRALTQSASGSGAKYTAKGDDGETSFWTKGEGAMLQFTGGKEMTCAEEVIG